MPHATLTRRTVLQAAGALTLFHANSGSAAAAASAERKLVIVILRGAADGLSAVPAFADPDYARLRSRLAIAPPSEKDGALPLAQGFGLHPQMPFLHSLWTEQSLAVLHAAASPYRDRSHFDGQDVLESGGAKVFAIGDGWLNRALAPPAAREAVGIGRTIPLILRGPAPVKSWSPSFIAAPNADTVSRLMDLYAGDPVLGPSLAQAVETSAIAGSANMPEPGGMRGAYGAGANLQMAEAATKLLSAPGGPAAAAMSIDGWDTHANQGAATGQIAQRFKNLDDTLKALKTGLGTHWAKTVVIVATEFGRTVAMNGTNGSDHGQGSVAFCCGGAVKGGRILGDWPGLSPKALFEGRDLAPVNDLRALFAAALAQHWGLDRTTLETRIFPDAKGLARFEGLITT